jgi:UDP-N-acetylglucosamine--N-acetylmuramyl-(pentapeptide) pyrophosphoryl-undecaprenol N-acetylglucosamine transferase
MGKLQRVLIMAGGTGGHIYPGLAVARKLREQGVQVDWLGTEKGLEARVVPEAGFPIHYISISGVRGKGLQSLLMAPWRLMKAVMQARQIISKLKPDAVLGMGGFASGPGGIAAWLLRTPLVIHEQNAKPGLTNKWLAKIAKKVLEGFPDTFSNRSNVVTTGNPVRTEIATLPSPASRNAAHKPLRLLVLGGSLGAAAINELVPRTIAKFPAELRPLVYHQTGEKHWDDAMKAYQQAGVTADVKPFITEMDKAYAWADIVLCRAGASTIAELCAAGLGAILVPFPFATDDHQTANANYMATKDAAYLIQQAALTEEKLAELLQQLSASPEKCLAMANAAYELRRVEATDKVFTICEEICQ